MQALCSSVHLSCWIVFRLKKIKVETLAYNLFLTAFERDLTLQTTEDMLSESPRCNGMVADLHFPRFFGTPIQCEIARRGVFREAK